MYLLPKKSGKTENILTPLRKCYKRTKLLRVKYKNINYY